MLRIKQWVIGLCCIVLVAGCWQPSLPEIPGIPESWSQLSDWGSYLQELGLPDLSSITDLPGLDSLPYFVDRPPGTIVYNGPTERSITINERVPGTDWILLSISNSTARFQNSTGYIDKQVGDSLDFDGAWPQVPDVTYNLRGRIYRIATDSVRLAGVHQVIIPNIQPAVAPANTQIGGYTMKFPFTVNVSKGEQIAGSTLGYGGSTEQGGIFTGLPEGASPYRKAGDSIQWLGTVRADIAAEYNLRLLPLYTDGAAQVGGVVTIGLPTH